MANTIMLRGTLDVIRRLAAVLLASVLLLPLAVHAANKSKLSIYQHGKPVSYMPCGDQSLQTRTAVLMGGGIDVGEAFTRMIDRMTKCADGSRGNPGNFIVVRAGGNPAYDSYITKKGPVAAVVTIVVPDRESALAISDPTNEVGQQVQALFKTAGAIFLTGGDQGDYYNFWKGTPVEQLLTAQVSSFGIPISGTSAGMMILSEIAYVPDATYTSAYALQNPEAIKRWLRRDFWSNRTPFLPLIDSVTDSHFDTRDRMGRLITFLADALSLGWIAYNNARAIGVDQETALVMEYTPNASENSRNITFNIEVMANPDSAGAVYILSPGKGSTLSVPQAGALTFTSINVQKYLPNGATQSYQLNVRAGVLSSPNGIIY